MSVVSCQSCEAPQPKEWQAGQLCVQCGGTVREEKRCGWCTSWTPEGKFCRECGSELSDAGHFGAARMLKQAGVDQFTLPERLKAMEPEQIQHFQRLYQKHYVIVIRFLDEVDRCQQDLVQQHFSAELEGSLVKQLPYDEESLALYNKNYAQPLSEKQLQLEFIVEHSPHELTRQLTLLARLQSGEVGNEHESQSQAHVEKVLALLDHEDEKIALEAAISLSHWSFYLPSMKAARASTRPYQDRLLEIATTYRFDNRLAIWSALISCMANPQLADEFNSELQQGLLSENDNLRFSCALYLLQGQVLRGYLAHQNEQMQYVAVVQLARHAPEHLASDLGRLSDHHLSAVLSSLTQPVAESLINPILDIIVDPQQALRNEALNLLVLQLDDVQLHTLLSRVESGRDDDLFFALIRESVFHAALINILLDNGLTDLANQPHGDMVANYLCEHTLEIINDCTPLWSRIVNESYNYLLTRMLNSIDSDDIDATSAILETFFMLAQRDDSSMASSAVSIILDRYGEQELLKLLPGIKENNNQKLLLEIFHCKLSSAAENKVKKLAIEINFIDSRFVDEDLIAECFQHNSEVIVTLLNCDDVHIIRIVLSSCINVLNEQQRSPAQNFLSALFTLYKNRETVFSTVQQSDIDEMLVILLSYADSAMLDEMASYGESTQDTNLLKTILEFYGPNTRLHVVPRMDLDKSSAIISALAIGMDWSLLWDEFCRHSVIPVTTFWRLIDFTDLERVDWCVGMIYRHLEDDNLDDEAAHEYLLIALYIMGNVSQFSEPYDYVRLQNNIVDLFGLTKIVIDQTGDVFKEQNLKHYSVEHEVFNGIAGLMRNCGMSAPDNLPLWLNQLIKTLCKQIKILEGLDAGMRGTFIAAINDLRHNVDVHDIEQIELIYIDSLLSILQSKDKCIEE